MMTTPNNGRRRRRMIVIPLAALVAGTLTVLLAVFCLVPLARRAGAPEELANRNQRESTEFRAEPVGPAERAALSWLKANARGPGSVSPVAWGPHRLRSEVREVYQSAGMLEFFAREERDQASEAYPDVVVRLKFSAMSQRPDVEVLHPGKDRGTTVSFSPEVKEFDWLVDVRGGAVLNPPRKGQDWLPGGRNNADHGNAWKRIWRERALLILKGQK